MTITLMGNGKMALALARGLCAHHTLEVIGRDMGRLEAFEAAVGVSMEKHLYSSRLSLQGKSVIVCVKPANLVEVSEYFHDDYGNYARARVIYSVLAGVSLESLRGTFWADGYVRVMPNLAAEVGRSMSAVVGDEAFASEALELFGSIGNVRWLGSEKELNIATALSGSGPAYLALIAEALSDGAVREGLKREDAEALMRGLFDGFAALIQTQHPALLKDAVMSPGGTTAAGYGALESNGVRHGCMEAIRCAFERSKLLGQ